MQQRSPDIQAQMPAIEARRLIDTSRRRGGFTLPAPASRLRPLPRGFTLIELLLAAMISVIVVSSLSMSIGQLGRSRDVSKQHLHGYLRADAALNALRSDIISVIRTDDLFFTRLLIINDTSTAGDRDEIVLFNTHLRPVRDVHSFTGEGIEYETHYRIEEDELSPVLWRRRDNMPDDVPAGGGVATPIVEGLVGLYIEAYDGYEWVEEWDSDIDGLPFAVRISVTASGHRDDEDFYAGPFVDLRTVVPIDRVLPPRDIFEEEERILEELAAAAGQQEGDAGIGEGMPEGFEGDVLIDEEGNVTIDGEAMPPDIDLGGGGRDGGPSGPNGELPPIPSGGDLPPIPGGGGSGQGGGSHRGSGGGGLGGGTGSTPN